MRLISSVSALLASSAALSFAAAAPVQHRPAVAAKPATAPAAAAAETLPIVDIPYKQFVLPNGLTVIAIEDHRTPMVAVQVWHHVGSANETPGRTGFAHLFEHLVFQGSQHANTDWFKPMAEIGATAMNGTTSQDRTNYFQVVPRSSLDRTLWLEADRMAHLLPVVTQATLDEQRGVVQNEKRQRSNDPTGEVPDRIATMTYPAGHPYSWQVIGSMEDLNAATLKDVGDFYEKWYGAANTLLVIAGDIAPEEARAKAEKYFGFVPAGPPLARPREWIARMSGVKRDEMVLKIASPDLVFVWNVPGRGNRDNVLLSLVQNSLTGNRDRPLTRRLIYDELLATDVSVQIDQRQLGSQFIIDVTAKPGADLKRIEGIVREELARIMEKGPPADLLQRLKFRNYVSYVGALEKIDVRAQTLANGWIYAGSADYYRNYQQWIREATPASVADAARRWLTDGEYILQSLPEPEYRTAAADPTQGPMPALEKPASFNLPPLQHATLSNGIRVALAEFHQTPIVNVSLDFDMGASPDRDSALPNLSGLAVMQTMNGTTHRSADAIAREQEELGSGMAWQLDLETTRFRMASLKARLDPSLALMADILLHPAYPEVEWRRDREIAIDQLKDQAKTPGGKVAQLLPILLYGKGHPYAPELTPENLAKIRTEDFRRIYRRWVRPDNATIFVAGDTTLAEIVPKLEKVLGEWRAPAEKLPAKAPLPIPPVRTAPRVVLVDQPDAKSSIVLVHQPGPARSDPQWDSADAFNAVIGGNFLARLNMNLREDKHWSYGARAELSAQKLLGGFSAAAIVQTDKTADSMKEIDRELRESITTRPPTDAEISQAKNQMLLAMPFLLASNVDALKLYTQQFEMGLPEDYWNRYAGRISALTDAQIAAAGKRLVDPPQWTWLVVGDLSKVEQEVRALNLGEVVVMDAEGKRLR